MSKVLTIQEQIYEANQLGHEIKMIYLPNECIFQTPVCQICKKGGWKNLELQCAGTKKF